MPDIEPLRFPSREGRVHQQDEGDLHSTCSGRRRPCALLNSPSPSASNALYNIQELKTKVENWCQQSGKYKPHNDQNKHRYSRTLRFPAGDSDIESEMSTKLFVEGFAITTRESCPLSPLLKKINDVLGEAVYLIERLEADRQDVEEALCKEKKRRTLLEGNVDRISLWMQQEHRVAVQEEHEACIRDISELKWHLKLEREKLEKVQERLSHADLLNQHLHEDVNFAKKQIPIVEENVALQRSIIHQINAAQAEADTLHSKMQNDLTVVEKEFRKMELESNNEKTSSEHALLAEKNQLANCIEELNQLKMLEERLYTDVSDSEKMITLTEENCAAIRQRIPERMEKEAMEKHKVSNLRCQIDDEMQRNKKLKEKVVALQEDVEKSKVNREGEVSCVEEQLHSKQNAFITLCNENMEYDQEVEDYKRQISESEKALKQLCEERRQMLQELTDHDERRERAKAEVTQVVARHSVIRAKLDKQRQLTFMEEQRARSEIENLRRELTGQVSALEILQNQCANMSEELYRQKRSAELASHTLQSEFEGASSTMKALETQMQDIKTLSESMEKIHLKHRNTLTELEREKKIKRDQLRAAKDLYAEGVRRYDSDVGRISELNKECEEYRDAADEMDKIVESIPGVITKLECAADVLQFKEKSAALITSTLRSDINKCLQRTQRSMQTHTAHLTVRKREMEHTKEALTLALKENKQLASEYKSLEKILMDAKQEAVCVLSRKNHAHKSYHFYTQLSLLQKRMHKALVKYFKQHSLYSRAELDRCQALSKETDQKIKTAQEALSEEIQLISAFLQSLTDDSTTIDDAGANRQARPGAAGSNE